MPVEILMCADHVGFSTPWTQRFRERQVAVELTRCLSKTWQMVGKHIDVATLETGSSAVRAALSLPSSLVHVCELQRAVLVAA